MGANIHYTVVTPTIVVSTAPAYSAGDDIGGIIALPSSLGVSDMSGALDSLLITDVANQKAPLIIFLLDSLPTGTYTDNAAFTLAAADVPKVLAMFSVLTAAYTSDGTTAAYNVGHLGYGLKSTSSGGLYMLVYTSGTPTYVATTDLRMRLGVLQY